MRLSQALTLTAALLGSSFLVASPGDFHCHRQSPGDLNSDQVLDISDVIMLSQYFAAGVKDPCTSFRAMDVNGDGVIDVADLQVLANKVFGDGGAAPAPPEESYSWTSGDVNNDGRIDQADADDLDAYLERRIERLDAGIDAGDVNGDGALDHEDVKELERELTR